MGIAAESGSAAPAIPDAAARVLEFAQVARPGDVPLILSALSAAELNAGIARLGARLPEAVIDHVVTHGSVHDVSPFVRASMAEGDIRALLMGAEHAAQNHLPGVTAPDPDRPCEPHPDDPARWPLEDAVRQHLDNRPDRWRIMVRRLMEAGPLEYAQLVDLVQEVGAGAGEAAEGAP